MKTIILRYFAANMLEVKECLDNVVVQLFHKLCEWRRLAKVIIYKLVQMWNVKAKKMIIKIFMYWQYVAARKKSIVLCVLLYLQSVQYYIISENSLETAI